MPRLLTSLIILASLAAAPATAQVTLGGRGSPGERAPPGPNDGPAASSGQPGTNEYGHGEAASGFQPSTPPGGAGDAGAPRRRY